MRLVKFLKMHSTTECIFFLLLLLISIKMHQQHTYAGMYINITIQFVIIFATLRQLTTLL